MSGILVFDRWRFLAIRRSAREQGAFDRWQTFPLLGYPSHSGKKHIRAVGVGIHAAEELFELGRMIEVKYVSEFMGEHGLQHPSGHGSQGNMQANRP